MIHIEKDDVNFLKFSELDRYENVVHAFSLKPLNFRNREDIYVDYRRLCSAINIDYKNIVKTNQGHTDNILVLEEKMNTNTADINLEYLKDVDGIITSSKNIAISTTSADCLCVVLYDSKKEVIANVHSGWRGTFKKIVSKAAVMMKEQFGCDAKDISAFLMPGIRKCHFEVDEDVMLECKRIFEYTGKIDEIISLGRMAENIQKYNIDNILINKILLLNEGVEESNIFDSGICSVCNKNIVHSRRADGKNFGLGTTIVMMK